jgi:predicted O-methyltransferase YrrM
MTIDLTYKFTEHWATYCEQLWPQIFPAWLASRRRPRTFMEIGSYEGRSAVWLIENLMEENDMLYCVDTWEGSEEHVGVDMASVKERFYHNVAIAVNKRALYDEQVVAQQGKSCDVLPGHMVAGRVFDIIYVDGSHRAADVLSDAIMSWHLLAPGGVMIFDDYLWGDPSNPLGRPKLAIDAFTNIYGPQLSFVCVGYQLAIAKVAK